MNYEAECFYVKFQDGYEYSTNVPLEFQLCVDNEMSAGNGCENGKESTNANSTGCQQQPSQQEQRELSSQKYLDNDKCTHKCKVCDKTFKGGKMSLKRHMKKMHLLKRSFVCKHCNKCLASLISLENHLRIHIGEKPYICDHCGRSYAQLSNLYTHNKKMHHGIRPYPCPQCHKRFFNVQNREQHKLTHGTEKRPIQLNIKPYVCHLCNKSFILMVNLIAHKKLQNESTIQNNYNNNSYSCDQCGHWTDVHEKNQSENTFKHTHG